VNGVVRTSHKKWHHFIFNLRLQETYLVYILKAFTALYLLKGILLVLILVFKFILILRSIRIQLRNGSIFFSA